MSGDYLQSRAVVRLSPQDGSENPVDFLHGLVTNDVRGELPVWTGLLTAQGKVLFDFLVWREGDDLLLDCEADAADALAAALCHGNTRVVSNQLNASLAAHLHKTTRR